MPARRCVGEAVGWEGGDNKAWVPGIPSINVAAAAIGGAIGAGIAIWEGGSVRDIAANAVGGAVTGGMAGLTMGGSLAVQVAGGTLAGSSDYMASNIVKGEMHTAEGTAVSAMSGAAGAMTGQVIGKTGEVVMGAVNQPHVNYIKNTNTANASPLKVDFKNTYGNINANERVVDTATEVIKQAADVAKDVYVDTLDK
jgi:hypothetical protein